MTELPESDSWARLVQKCRRGLFRNPLVVKETIDGVVISESDIINFLRLLYPFFVLAYFIFIMWFRKGPVGALLFIWNGFFYYWP